MTESRDYLELTFRSINCFANDGKLDAKELRNLFAIAQKDGIVDANERRVLTNIINKLTPEELDADMQKALADIHKQLNA